MTKGVKVEFKISSRGIEMRLPCNYGDLLIGEHIFILSSNDARELSRDIAKMADAYDFLKEEQ